MKWKKEAVFVHLCTLPPQEDILFTFFPGKTTTAKFHRAFRRFFTISESHSLARRLFKSRSAMERERERHLRTGYYMIHPFSMFRLLWSYLMLFAFILAFSVIPVYTIQCSEGNQGGLWTFLPYFDVTHCMFFVVDIVVNMFTGYHSKSNNEIVVTPLKSIVLYLRYHFWVDIITSLPLDHILNLVSNAENITKACRIICRFRLLKVLKVPTFKKSFYLFMEQFELSVIWPQVVFLAILVVFTIHWIATIFYDVFIFDFMIDPSLKTQYEQCNDTMDHYSSLVAVAFLAFRVDFALGIPCSTLRKLLCGTLSLGCAVCYPVIIAYCLRWIAIDRAPVTKYEDVELQITSYLRYLQLPTYVQNRVLEYYAYRWNGKFFDESKILSVLSNSLREEVAMFQCRRLLEKVSFFSEIPLPVLMRISQCLKLEVYLVNDIIMRAGDVGNSMYFIASGTVAIFTNTGREVCHLEDGGHMGEVALVLEEQVRIANVVAVESCEIYRLERGDFKRAVAPYPDILLQIERIAEERLQNFLEMRNKRQRRRATQRTDTEKEQARKLSLDA